jgi:hypothetical protein
MPTDMDKKTEDELVGGIAFAMIGAAEMKKSKPTWRAEDDPRFVLARRIVAHLKLSNWLISRGKPIEGHSTHPKQEE